MRHVDHAHLTEGEGQTEGDEKQDGTDADAGEGLVEDDRHEAAPGRVRTCGLASRRLAMGVTRRRDGAGSIPWGVAQDRPEAQE
ncbi:hypothetical protein TUSST3_68510 [Streptomyces sp. TUS-ST3]|nr:hypothetical protein TUSST3_68510 [Streptomyces sp. TUS-ST3]